MSEVRIGIILLGLLLPGSIAAGETGGVGIQAAVQDGWVTVAQVVAGAPAARAGLRAGDRIAKINGQSMRDVALSNAVQRLTGPAGEKVTLTVHRQEASKITEFDVTLTREIIRSIAPTLAVLSKYSPVVYTPTKEAQDVEWHANKIVSRVLPYPDLDSLLIRLPIAHAVVTGQGVKAAVVQRSGGEGVPTVLRHAAPRAEVHNYTLASCDLDARRLVDKLREAACRVVVVTDVNAWADQDLLTLSRMLLSDKSVVVVPSDLSEDSDKIEVINKLQSLGVLTVGRLNSQATVMGPTAESRRPFNRQIRRIKTDVFAAGQSYPDPRTPATLTAGVAALVLERWPDLDAAEVRRKIATGARAAWQGTSVETGQWAEYPVDPMTTRYTPEEKAIFRFRVLNAAGALEIDTEIPWFLNMLNCHKAWEITKGKGAVVAVTDMGFHLRHPALAGHVKATGCLGPYTFESPDQNFHGTEMSRLVLAVAPEAQILPLLCSPLKLDELTPNVAKSFEFAVEQKADAISSSWPAGMSKSEELLTAIRQAADRGVVVSWIHYPEPYPGILRPDFAYSWWRDEKRLGFSDRFLINPPEFHPIEGESGLSNTAPQAAGLAALVKSVNPALTPREVERLIVDNSDPVGKAILIPDAYRIVQAARKKTRG